MGWWVGIVLLLLLFDCWLPDLPLSGTSGFGWCGGFAFSGVWLLSV